MNINKRIFFLNILFILAGGVILEFNHTFLGHSFTDSLTSYFIGVFCYVIPQSVFFYVANRQKLKKTSAILIVYNAIYAFLLKFMLVILLLGIAIKFFELNDTVVILSFVSMVIFNLLIYPISIISLKR